MDARDRIAQLLRHRVKATAGDRPLGPAVWIRKRRGGARREAVLACEIVGYTSGGFAVIQLERRYRLRWEAVRPESLALSPG